MRAAVSWGAAGNQKIAKYVGQMKQANVRAKGSQKKTKKKVWVFLDNTVLLERI